MQKEIDEQVTDNLLHILSSCHLQYWITWYKEIELCDIVQVIPVSYFVVGEWNVKASLTSAMLWLLQDCCPSLYIYCNFGMRLLLLTDKTKMRERVVKEFRRKSASHGTDFSRWNTWCDTVQSGATPKNCSTDANVDVFAVYTTEQLTMLFSGLDNPQILPLALGGSGPPPLTHSSLALGPIQLTYSNNILIPSADFAGLTNVANTHTYRQTMLLSLYE